MNKQAKWVIGLMIALGAAHGHAVNLVSNGSFEDPLSDWTFDFAPAGSQFGVTSNEAFSGNRSFVFSASAMQHDAISQSLPTTAGTTYTISLWVKNIDFRSDSLQLGWENSIALDLTPLTGPLESWQKLSVNALATTSGSVLSIRGFDGPGNIFVDDVRVEAVPEPGTMTALGLGAIALLRRGARRTN